VMRGEPQPRMRLLFALAFCVLPVGVFLAGNDGALSWLGFGVCGFILAGASLSAHSAGSRPLMTPLRAEVIKIAGALGFFAILVMGGSTATAGASAGPFVVTAIAVSLVLTVLAVPPLLRRPRRTDQSTAGTDARA
jgi:peptidoglycan/LPS O-acetylase OafA/YrhL